MKDLYAIALLLGFLPASAATHIVSVSSNQFNPSNLNVLVGDVIRWEWVEGPHNTVSLNIPTGAASWSSQLFSASESSFSYSVTVPGVYDYYCEVHGVSMSGTVTASGLVPVTLSGFNVSMKNNQPYLRWTTEQESNSDYFAVRRSYDGAIFTEIGRVPAAGNSPGVKNYSFIDANVKANIKYVYYELAITDRDGSRQLSPIKLVRNNEHSKKMITSISPNPVSAAGHLMIQFNSDVTGKLMAIVADVNGRQVLKYELSALVGVNNGHVHLGDLPGGHYVVQFILNGQKESYKIRKK